MACFECHNLQVWCDRKNGFAKSCTHTPVISTRSRKDTGIIEDCAPDFVSSLDNLPHDQTPSLIKYRFGPNHIDSIYDSLWRNSGDRSGLDQPHCSTLGLQQSTAYHKTSAARGNYGDHDVLDVYHFSSLSFLLYRPL